MTKITVSVAVENDEGDESQYTVTKEVSGVPSLFDVLETAVRTIEPVYKDATEVLF